MAVGPPGILRTTFPSFPIEPGGVIAVADIASIIRITARQSAVWRMCAGCTALGPLAPDETKCADCRAEPQRPRRRRLPRAA